MNLFCPQTKKVCTNSKESSYLISSANSGFTLIELLIVIVILGILGGVVVSVINPAEQQRKARQTVMRSSLEKLHMAQLACINAHLDPVASCGALTDLGVSITQGDPQGVTYTAAADGTSTPNTVSVAAAEDTDGDGTAECGMTYTYTVDGANAGTVNKTVTGSECLVDFQ